MFVEVRSLTTGLLSVILRNVRMEVNMKKVYESIMTGLKEAVEERERLPRHTVSVEPVKKYNAELIRKFPFVRESR